MTGLGSLIYQATPVLPNKLDEPDRPKRVDYSRSDFLTSSIGISRHAPSGRSSSLKGPYWMRLSLVTSCPKDLNSLRISRFFPWIKTTSRCDSRPELF